MADEVARHQRNLNAMLNDKTAAQPPAAMVTNFADFLQFAQVICLDALHRQESCGAHFRTEFQTQEGEAARQDKAFSHVALWRFQQGQTATRYTEELVFEQARPTERSYK